jgi:AbrB family looped-hinge helix DNA binding protein
MAKVSPELQVTIPKALADRFGIRPGDEVDWTASEDALRLVPVPRETTTNPLSTEERLELFRQSMERQQEREKANPPVPRQPGEGRGWTREDLYDPPRGLPR